MENVFDVSILVTEGTGAQGGATARALLSSGRAVRVLARQLDSPAAQALASIGAHVVQGSYEDADSLQVALEGVKGVFSVQVPSLSGQDSERQLAMALIAVARSAG
jgi:uncharacterized protein YbjT (DUF2867 family)